MKTYYNEGQTVPAGAPLLKLAVGTGASPRTVFALAPAAGDVTQAQARVGQYLSAGTPYARLTPRGPVRVRVAATDAVRLRPGDSLHVQRGPMGLIGHTTPLTALFPDVATGTVVLVLGRLGWPPGTAVRVVIMPLSAQTLVFSGTKK
ncbi:HlyD family efflux transporter periplasmic adaptor subunit [Hymenobacter sp. UYCo722]|uniref:HlyD family efflux transporter periplasmic adaptor subunit n=1 Tax=Hymenobacter sp. UYCo722 TaxID=3156335 RepID=UPI0033989A88